MNTVTPSVAHVAQHDAFSGLLEVLRNDPEIGSRLKETDEIERETARAVECVMLDIAFSPVLPNPGNTLEQAVEVAYKGEDGRYVLEGSPLRVVTEGELKVMRARYLITNGREMQKRSPLLRRLSSIGNSVISLP